LRGALGGIVGFGVLVLLLVPPGELSLSNINLGGLSSVLGLSSLLGVWGGWLAWRFRRGRGGGINVALSLLVGFAGVALVVTGVFAGLLFPIQLYLLDESSRTPVESLWRYLWGERKAIALPSALIGGLSAIFTWRRIDREK
jgi:hypothetical protein